MFLNFFWSLQVHLKSHRSHCGLLKTGVCFCLSQMLLWKHWLYFQSAAVVQCPDKKQPQQMKHLRVYSDCSSRWHTVTGMRQKLKQVVRLYPKSSAERNRPCYHLVAYCLCSLACFIVQYVRSQPKKWHCPLFRWLSTSISHPDNSSQTCP